MLALIDRQHSGGGQVVDVGMHDCLAVSAELANPYWFYPRVVVHRQTCRHAQPTPTAPALFQCGDGRYVYFVLFVADLKPFRALVEWMATLGVEADLNEPQYEDAAYRQANFGHIQGLVEVFFLLQDAVEAYHDGQARGLPIGVAYAPDDLFARRAPGGQRVLRHRRARRRAAGRVPRARRCGSRRTTRRRSRGRRGSVSTPTRCSPATRLRTRSSAVGGSGP